MRAEYIERRPHLSRECHGPTNEGFAAVFAYFVHFAQLCALCSTFWPDVELCASALTQGSECEARLRCLPDVLR